MRDAVEVAFEVGIYHIGVAVLKVSVNFPQCVFATSTGPEPVTHRQKFVLEDRFYYPFHRCLDDSVLDGGNSQRACFASRFGYLHSFHGLRIVSPLFENHRQFIQVLLGIGRKCFNALFVYPRCAMIGLYLFPCRSQCARSINLVDQTEPFCTFDTVTQCRQHTFRPDVTIYPFPFGWGRFSLFSPFRHFRFLAHAFVLSSLPALLTLPYSSALRYYEGSDSCHLHLVAGLPAYLAQTSRHSVSKHVGDPNIALTASSAYLVCFRLRLESASSPSLPAETSSLYYGLPVRFRLLSTPPRDDAVTFRYGVLAYSDTDFHRAVCAPSQAHGFPPARE